MLVATPGPPKRDAIRWQVLIGVVVGVLVGLCWPHFDAAAARAAFGRRQRG
jgi:Na+/H+-dicarboxylate symporter